MRRSVPEEHALYVVALLEEDPFDVLVNCVIRRASEDGESPSMESVEAAQVTGLSLARVVNPHD